MIRNFSITLLVIITFGCNTHKNSPYLIDLVYNECNFNDSITQADIKLVNDSLIFNYTVPFPGYHYYCAFNLNECHADVLLLSFDTLVTLVNLDTLNFDKSKNCKVIVWLGDYIRKIKESGNTKQINYSVLFLNKILQFIKTKKIAVTRNIFPIQY